ncbi:hypothetical protein AAY473_012067 [Plecturocebus cupreus]
MRCVGFHHDGQAGLELLTSGDPPTSASQSARITGIQSHSVAQVGMYGWDLSSLQPLPFGLKQFSCQPSDRDRVSVGQAALELLTSSDPPALASQSAGITGSPALPPCLEYSGTISAHATSTCQVQAILMSQSPFRGRLKSK